MKRIICLLIALVALFCGRAEKHTANEDGVFAKNENGNLQSSSGVEYAWLTNEGVLYYLGELEFVGGVQGETEISHHLGFPYETGMFAIKNAENSNILIRYSPDNEWFSIYRDASLDKFDFFVDNCVRLEFVSEKGMPDEDGAHAACGYGICDSAVIAEFLSDVRSQKSPSEAGLYEMIRKTDGMLENCYLYGVIYGYFAEEPNLVVRMNVMSFNDLAYSVSIDGRDYVLPESWLVVLGVE